MVIKAVDAGQLMTSSLHVAALITLLPIRGLLHGTVVSLLRAVTLNQTQVTHRPLSSATVITY